MSLEPKTPLRWFASAWLLSASWFSLVVRCHRCASWITTLHWPHTKAERLLNVKFQTLRHCLKIVVGMLIFRTCETLLSPSSRKFISSRKRLTRNTEGQATKKRLTASDRLTEGLPQLITASQPWNGRLLDRSSELGDFGLVSLLFL